jgi:hypothetical protein
MTIQNTMSTIVDDESQRYKNERCGAFAISSHARVSLRATNMQDRANI